MGDGRLEKLAANLRLSFNLESIRLHKAKKDRVIKASARHNYEAFFIEYRLASTRKQAVGKHQRRAGKNIKYKKIFVNER